MIKHEMFDLLNNTKKQTNHGIALSNLLRVAGVHHLLTETYQNNCMGLLCSALDRCLVGNLVIAEGLTELYMVDDAENGQSD
jgi:hypothetical protein